MIIIEEVIELSWRKVSPFQAFLSVVKAIEIIMGFDKERKLHFLEVKIYTKWKIKTKRNDTESILTHGYGTSNLWGSERQLILQTVQLYGVKITKSTGEDEKGPFTLIKFESENQRIIKLIKEYYEMLEVIIKEKEEREKEASKAYF